jgi:hypothetical protein
MDLPPGPAGAPDFVTSKANRFGPDPPFRIVMDCKAIVSLSAHFADTREIRILLLMV